MGERWVREMAEEEQLKKEFDKRVKVLSKIEKEAKEELYKDFLYCYERGFLCYYCGNIMNLSWGTELSFSIDHYIPKSKGGLDTSDNLVFCCAECNFLKGNKDPDWFIANFNRLKKRRMKKEKYKAIKSSKDDREREAYKQMFRMQSK